MRDTMRRTAMRGRNADGAWTMRALACAAVVALLGTGASGCSVNPATGETQLALIGEGQEIEMGRQAARQVGNTLGLYREGDLDGYVSGIGSSMAKQTERPDLPWRFSVADDPTVNAFALPGGFIYLTRGIMAHFNSEAEMAAVLGHEIGHVTARHSVEQMSRAQLAQVGLGLGAVLSDEVARFSNVIGAGLSVLFLKYSRDDESQADRLGVRYMMTTNYDPHEAVDVFQMLDRQSQAAGGSGVPTWLSTHPPPGDRIQHIRRIIDSIPKAELRTTVKEREAFLRRLDGMAYGPDPRNGYFEEGEYLHPRFRIRMEFPEDWKKQNMPRVAAAGSPSEDAVIQVGSADSTSHREVAQGFFSSQNVQALRTQEREINDFPAVVGEFRAQSGQTTVHGLAAFLDDGGRAFQILAYAAEGAYGRYESLFEDVVTSFERLTDDDVLSVEPLRIELIRVDEAASIEELARDRDAPIEPTALALLNAREVNERIEAGTTIKWVAGELPEGMRRPAGAEAGGN